MTIFSPKEFVPAEDRNVRIVDNGKVVKMQYAELTAIHESNLWWGVAVGYRAMQMAALALSKDALWSRDNLIVVSGHPGPGVIDAIKFVTGCNKEDGSLTVMENPNCVSRCNSEMKFEWWISDGKQSAHVMLREDFVPLDFYTLIDRRVYDEKIDGDDRRFELFKVNMCAHLWGDSLDKSFSVKFEAPLAKGEIPAGSNWTPKEHNKEEAMA